MRVAAPKTALWVVVLLFAGSWLVAVARFAAARPVIEVRFPAASKNSSRRNLAHFATGTVVRASSALWAARHHPGYVVDGWSTPSVTAKWVSELSDPRPWIEVEFAYTHHIDEVALVFASAYEQPTFAIRKYHILCYRDKTLIGRSAIKDNAMGFSRHQVTCRETNRIRIQFDPTPSEIPARIYELEVWGA